MSWWSIFSPSMGLTMREVIWQESFWRTVSFIQRLSAFAPFLWLLSLMTTHPSRRYPFKSNCVPYKIAYSASLTCAIFQICRRNLYYQDVSGGAWEELSKSFYNNQRHYIITLIFSQNALIPLRLLSWRFGERKTHLSIGGSWKRRLSFISFCNLVLVLVYWLSQNQDDFTTLGRRKLKNWPFWLTMILKVLYQESSSWRTSNSWG